MSFTIFLWLCVEFINLKAWGQKLLCSLAVRQRILLYLLPDGSIVMRLWPGWVSSQNDSYCSSVNVDKKLARDINLLNSPQEVEPSLCFCLPGWRCVKDHDKVSVMLIPRNLKLSTCSTPGPLTSTGAGVFPHFLKYTINNKLLGYGGAWFWMRCSVKQVNTYLPSGLHLTACPALFKLWEQVAVISCANMSLSGARRWL